MIVGIHFQGVRDNGETLEKLLSLDKPFIGFVVPAFLDKNLENYKGKIVGRIYREDQYYPLWFADALKENKNNPNLILGQEGFAHYCEPCYEKFELNERKFPDPWHEHICIDNGKHQSLGEQIYSIRNGAFLTIEKTEIIPETYCPPNHLYDKTTLIAAKQIGFYYFAVRNFLGLPVYNDEGLILLPEAKIGELHDKTSPAVYTYYGDLAENEHLMDRFNEIIKNSSREFNPVSKLAFRSALNQAAVLGYKKFRDWKKSFG